MTPHIINVVTANIAGDCKLRLEFDDGATQVLDFKPFLQRSLHPQIRAYLDETRFATFRVEYGELVWGDYELCFPVIDLYTNQIDHHHPMQAAA
jgi:hypothetical protein